MKEKPDVKTIKETLNDRGYVVENHFRHYAVLIPIVDMEEGIHILYEVRAEDLDRQPGEICFPGGEVEEGETYAQCAIRETCEEIGLGEEDVELLDELTTIYGVGRFAMHCFPAILSERSLDRIKLNVEVGEVFTVPLLKLKEIRAEMYRAKIIQEGPEDFPYERVTGGTSYEWSRFTSPVPVYDTGDKVIWGLTGRATAVLLEALFGEDE